MRLTDHYETPTGYCERSISNKMMMIAELFEADVLSEDEALKACKTIIGQHAKTQGRTEDNAKYLIPRDAMAGTKVSDVAITSDSIVGCAITPERLGMK